MRQSRTRKKTPRGMVVSTQPTAGGGMPGMGGVQGMQGMQGMQGYMQDMGGEQAGGCVDCHDYFEIHV